MSINDDQPVFRSTSMSFDAEEFELPATSDPSERCHDVRAWARRHPRSLWTLCIVTLVMGLLFCLFEFLPIVDWLTNTQTFMQQHKVESASGLFFLIFFGVSLLLPVALLEMFGIFAFGPWLGLPLVFFATFLGNVFCFVAARSCCFAHAQTVLRSFGQPAVVFERMVSIHPWKITLLIRLSFIPMAIRNYFCSTLQPITLWVFSVCTFAAHVPYAILYTLIGTSVHNVKELTEFKSPSIVACFVLGLVFGIALFVATRHFYKRTLLEFEAENPSRDSSVMLDQTDNSSSVNYSAL